MSLQHQAVFYEGTDAFLEVALPFARDAVASGEPLIAVARTPNIEALRESLGGDAAAVDLRNSRDWYRSPGKAFSGFVGFALARPDASRIRMLGEPLWEVDWDAAVSEYAHYESVFNVIAKDSPIWAMCPYDLAALPDAILEHARATHPEVWADGHVHPCSEYVDPEAYCTQLAARPAPPGIRVRRFRITSDLSALRLAVAAEAEAAGVPRGRIGEFILAVHEVAANALTHGGDADGTVRTWNEERSFVCEIENNGPGLSETVAGYLPPAQTQERGRGLWLARQVCDLVEVQSRDGKTRVRLHAAHR